MNAQQLHNNKPQQQSLAMTKIPFFSISDMGVYHGGQVLVLRPKKREGRRRKIKKNYFYLNLRGRILEGVCENETNFTYLLFFTQTLSQIFVPHLHPRVLGKADVANSRKEVPARRGRGCSLRAR
jgi:hypothetical protein